MPIHDEIYMLLLYYDSHKKKMTRYFLTFDKIILLLIDEKYFKKIRFLIK